jgi:glyoxylase-like metal-dependent hydrolase (beta-lactamase superfamily II)
LSGQPVVTARLSDKVSVLSGPGGNIGVFCGAEEKLVIDSGIAGASPAILKAVAALGPAPLRILVNTHWHYDHTDGNEAFHTAGALIAGHENVRRRMQSTQHIAFFNADMPASPPAALPEFTFGAGTTFHISGEEIRVTHVEPAHTDGDSIVQFVNANIVHGGDVVFSGTYPFIDGSTGGSIGGMARAASRVLELTDSSTKIIPGHGPVTTPEELRQYRDMLADVGDQVKKLKAQGLDAAAITASKPTRKYDDQWGKGFLSPDQFVAVVLSAL